MTLHIEDTCRPEPLPKTQDQLAENALRRDRRDLLDLLDHLYSHSRSSNNIQLPRSKKS